MNIAYILPSLVKEGPGIVVYELIKQMISRGNYCCVFYFDSKSKNLIDFPCETKNISFFGKIDFSIFDVVHSNCMRPDMWVFFHKPLRKTKTLFITTLHDIVEDNLRYQYGKFVSFIASRVWMTMCKRHDFHVVLTKIAKKYYSKWFNEKSLKVIYNSRTLENKQLSEDEKAEILRFKGSSKLLGMNCLLTARKGVDLAIKALKFLPDIKLFIAGNGQEIENLKELAKEEKVSDRVYFAGYKEDAYRYLPYYDVYLMPSRSEGFSLAMIEAVAAKVPVVLSDIDIFKEIFSANEVCFFYSENPNSLAKAAQEALNTNKTDKAYNRYINQYSIESFGEKYMKLYNSKINGGGYKSVGKIYAELHLEVAA